MRENFMDILIMCFVFFFKKEVDEKSNDKSNFVVVEFIRSGQMYFKTITYRVVNNSSNINSFTSKYLMKFGFYLSDHLVNF